ncbi:RecF/RecN/SMC N terminal domain-containing protein [Pterulicium gracile]|uniref:RecF/RecN/SMC N terminal domain-containing protein n=1 Tax=Pterulicium gracile TaxID=1884261 RepID=A0A5C3QFJ9_9AGAR|nr:RecF/RecN/SMC N terminal domain-containing protein [Pterula gracilis]
MTTKRKMIQRTKSCRRSHTFSPPGVHRDESLILRRTRMRRWTKTRRNRKRSRLVAVLLARDRLPRLRVDRLLRKRRRWLISISTRWNPTRKRKKSRCRRRREERAGRRSPTTTIKKRRMRMRRRTNPSPPAVPLAPRRLPRLASSSKPTSSKHTSSAKPSSSRKTPFKPISSSKGKGKAKASLPIVSEDASSEDASSVKDDADEEEVNSTPTPTLRTRTPSTAHTSPSDDEEDVPSDTEQSPFNKEESPEPTSFLDPAPPASKKLLAPMPPLLLTERDEGPQWRLVIHKMALVDFKSYAGRQEIGPFHKSFSAIVGPNGSGKSNTIDALLFVFGYRATKMRQAKLSELIHNSARFKDLDSCSVEVHFREIMDIPDTDQYKIRPNSALVVARHAYKSEASKYTVDGKTSSYADVRTLLKGKGIDLDHNRFLILQGEVESIAQMKPKGTDTDPEGLLEYLEDIIGTNRFIEPLNEAQAKIDTLNDERTIKLNRLRCAPFFLPYHISYPMPMLFHAYVNRMLIRAVVH